jgi:redox-sensitive bicupin YhaK (pirin superfamily)
VQLWVALPEEHRNAARGFQHHAPEPVQIDGAEIKVFLGSLAGDTSPVETFTPLLGAQVDLDPRAVITLAVDPTFEHGLLVDSGDVRLDDARLGPAELGYVPRGRGALTLTNESDVPARTILLGGPPFEEEIVMWWNFIGRSHEDIVRAREDWEAASERFGDVNGYRGGRLRAPELPNAVITPRGKPPTPCTDQQGGPGRTRGGKVGSSSIQPVDDASTMR